MTKILKEVQLEINNLIKLEEHLLKEVQLEINKLREVEEHLFKEAIKKEFEYIFKKFPFIKSFSWPQYTPYFNDGDPCYFRVCCDTETIHINGLCFEDSDTEEYEICRCVISELISKLDKNLLQKVYGDHVRVVIKTDGSFELEDHYHH